MVFLECNMKSIKIGNSSGFWGDDPTALKRQIKGGNLDYITSDYLAEVSMTVLKKQQLKNNKLGYVTDFIDHLKLAADEFLKKRPKIITNAGGNNPKKCASLIYEYFKDKKNTELKIAYIEGDNIINNIEEWSNDGEKYLNIENKRTLPNIKKIISANAYYGIAPIIEALKQNPDIIITGRATDSAIVIAPLVHELNWKINDWDKLANAMLAAHIIECGAQSTGGNFTDWKSIQNWENFGFPIIKMFEDSSFYVTKHKNTGGIVTENTVKEQIVYEIANPKKYYSPDVVTDLTEIKVNQIEKDIVEVKGAKGSAPSDFVKISMAYEDGFKASGSLIFAGAYSKEKAKTIEDFFWKRLGVDFNKTNTEYIGYNSCSKSSSDFENANEILIKFHAYDYDIRKIKKFSEHLSTIILSSPQGLAVTGGRPRPTKVLTYWPTLIKKERLKFSIGFYNKTNIKQLNNISLYSFKNSENEEVYDNLDFFYTAKNTEIKKESLTKIKLYKICLARSGDKGNTANIGLIARNKEVYEFIKQNIDSKLVKSFFKSICKGKVVRYDIPGINSMNFLLFNVLDGGGTKSLRADAQGKTLASLLLNMKIDIPKKILNSIK